MRHSRGVAPPRPWRPPAGNFACPPGKRGKKGKKEGKEKGKGKKNERKMIKAKGTREKKGKGENLKNGKGHKNCEENRQRWGKLVPTFPPPTPSSVFKSVDEKIRVYLLRKCL